jgi:hypothetical protein
MRHYPPIRALAVIAGMSVGGVHLLLQRELEKLNASNEHFIDIDDWSDDQLSTTYHRVVGIVDCTKISINTWHSNAFSKKKGGPTLNYQVVTHHSTGKPLHIYGPFKGSIHDAKVYKKSNIAKYLLNHNLKLIGDKAYVAPIKKNNRFYNKAQRIRYNVQLAQERIRIENHFANLKAWRVINNMYRGDIDGHYKIFWGCEILERIRNGWKSIWQTKHPIRNSFKTLKKLAITTNYRKDCLYQ